jgi:hypothetical protein
MAQIITHETKLPKISKKMPSWRGELEGTINTLKQRAQKIMRKTKLAKISKKLPSWRGELEETINTPSEGTNNYAQTKTSDNPPPQKIIAKLEGTINTPLEGTNNYAQTKTSKKRQYYVQNKTSEISKKLPSWRGQ